MKKIINLLCVITLSCIILSGKTSAKENEIQANIINTKDLERILLDEENINSNKKINPLWGIYEELSEEEKKLWGAIPDKYYIEYTPSYNPLETFSYDSLNTTDNIPAKYDLRNVNGKSYVSVMKNQGSLGLCWAFATNTSIETNILKRNLRQSSNPAVFSERHVDYMAASATNNIPYNSDTAITVYEEKYNPYSYGSRLGSGGAFSKATFYMGIGLSPADATGIWSSYDENHYTLSLKDVYNSENQSYSVTDYTEYPYIVDFNSEDDTASIISAKASWRDMIKKHVMNYGSAYVGTAAPQQGTSGACYIEDLKNKIGLINWNQNCNGNKLATYWGVKAGWLAGTHAMSIVGWDDDYELSYCSYTGTANIYGVNGYSDSEMTEEECKNISGTYHTIKGAWILQNSWGNSYSLNGVPKNFVYLAYDSGINGIGGIVKTVEKDFDNTYNLLGPRDYETSSQNNSRSLYFYKPKETEYLKRVAIETETTKEVTYNIYLDYPKSQNLLGTITASQPGLYSLSVDSQWDLPDDAFGITAIPTNGTNDIAVTNIYAFTDNTTSKPAAKTVVEYEKTNQNKYIYNFMTRTINVESGSIVKYKIKDTTGNDLSSSFSSMKSYVVANASGVEISFTTKVLDENSVYYVETYVNDELLGTDVFDTGMSLEGDGEENPYQIKDIHDFLYMYTENYSGYAYELVNNIDISYISNFEPLGLNLNKVAQGKLYGNNYYIKGLNQTGEYGGLFYKINMDIEELILLDVNINASVSAGSLAAYADNSYIMGVKTEGQINATESDALIGGIAGDIYMTDILKSLNKVKLNGGISGAFVGKLGFFSSLYDSMNIGKNFTNDNKSGSISTFFGTSDLSKNELTNLIDYNGTESPNCANIEEYEDTELYVDEVYYYNKSTCKYVGTPLNDTGLRDATNFNNFSKDLWNVTDGKYPTLNKFPITFIESINVNAAKNLFEGDILPLEVTINPLDATYKKLNYIFDNTNIELNENGEYYFTENGPLNLLIETTDASHVEIIKPYYAFSKEFEKTLLNRKYLFIKDEMDLNSAKEKLKVNNLELNADIDEYFGTGDTLKYSYNGETIGEFITLVSGDVTHDGYVNIADVLKIADHTINEDVLNTEEEIMVSDVTNDNYINIADVLKIADYTINRNIELRG